MNTSSGKTKVRTYESAYSPDEDPTLFNRALELVAEVGKTSLDLAVEQNAEVLASYRNVLNASSMPGLFLFDLAGQALQGYTTLQKSLLDLVAIQSSSVTQVVQGYSLDGRERETGCQRDPANDRSPEAGSIEDTTQLRADTLLAKKVVDLFVMQPSTTGKTGEEIGGVTNPKIKDLN